MAKISCSPSGDPAAQSAPTRTLLFEVKDEIARLKAGVKLRLRIMTVCIPVLIAALVKLLP